MSQFNSCHQLQFAALALCHSTVQERLQGRSDSDRTSRPAVASPLHGRTRLRLILICKYPLCWRYNTHPPLNEKSAGAASVPWQRRKHWKIQITLAIPPSLSSPSAPPPLPLLSICPDALHAGPCPSSLATSSSSPLSPHFLIDLFYSSMSLILPSHVFLYFIHHSHRGFTVFLLISAG